MIVFPIISSVLALLCAIVLTRDAIRRPRPDKVVWAIAFLMFALAAGTDAGGMLFGWTPWLARLYYMTGPALVVAYLAIGQLYLLIPDRMRRIGPGLTLFVTALWVSLVSNATVDESRLAEDGWEAIQRGPELVATAVAINIVGTLIIVGGSAWSAWRFWRRRIMKNRMIGVSLICGGTLAVAAGGSLTRFGHYEYLYIAMSFGIALIYLGVLVARTPDGDRLAQTSDRPAPAPRTSVGVGGISFIESLLERQDAEIDAVCAGWSVPREDGASLTRFEARRAWQLRSVLSPAGAAAFDRQSIPACRQLTELYHEVIIWNSMAPDGCVDTGSVKATHFARG